MPETFQIAFEAPIVEVVANQNITFPLLVIDDYLPWCAELKAERKRDGMKKIPASAAPFDRWRAEKSLDDNEPWLDDIVALVRSAKGAKRVLELSLAKDGRAADDIKAIVQSIPPYRVRLLAEDVSRLTPPVYGMAVPENPPAAGAESAGETGLPSNE